MLNIVQRNTRVYRRRGVYASPKVQVVRAIVHHEPVFFSISNPNDIIQKCHLGGAFYEPEELAIIGKHFPVGGRMCDIGANVGNHSLYAAKFLHADRCTVFEPNPPAVELLESNIFLNGLSDKFERKFLGLGLSSEPAKDGAIRTPANNLGGARLRGEGGGIEIETLDNLVADQSFDLIKIDVEGMEIAVLEGARGIIEAQKPALFVEVDQKNDEDFQIWLGETGYTVAQTFKRYPTNTNYLAVAA